MKKLTPIETLIQELMGSISDPNLNIREKTAVLAVINRAEELLALEKSQAILLIEHAAMFTGVATVDSDIAKLTVTDVYNNFYKEEE
jgi:hypothetical protein